MFISGPISYGRCHMVVVILIDKEDNDGEVSIVIISLTYR